jgi:hypothetical protein
MKVFVLCGVLSLSVGTYAGEPNTSPKVIEEPTLHDHYVAMKQMQQRLAGRSLDEQAKMQPQIQRAQQKACARLRRDEYRRQGGDEFLVFSLELEQWCQTSR